LKCSKSKSVMSLKKWIRRMGVIRSGVIGAVISIVQAPWSLVKMMDANRPSGSILGSEPVPSEATRSSHKNI
jgi:hypothetical protein